MMNETTGGRWLAGASCGLAAALIWAGWLAITRLGVTSTLDAFDLAALRFGTAGLLLLPVLARRGLALDRLGWPRLLIMIAGAGVPYALLAATGLRFAPAAQAAILIPGVIPLFVALLSAVCFGERFSAARLTGYALILACIMLIVVVPVARGGAWSVGHLFFLTAALVWAIYTVALRGVSITPLHAVALVSVGSAILYLPVYFLWRGPHFSAAPLPEILFQAAYQGIGSTIVALFFFVRAIEILGPSRGAAFMGLIPVLAALIGVVVLHEIPPPAEWLGVLAVGAGVFLASGGSLRRKAR